MSQIAPDIPELEHLPVVVRPFIYTRALARASRSGITLLLGLAVLCTLGAGGVVAGARLLGTPGSVLGGLAGAALAVYLFFRALVPWQTRRAIRSVERDIDWKTEYRDLIDGYDEFTRVVDAYKKSEARDDPRR
jgi:hypothetical protein